MMIGQWYRRMAKELRRRDRWEESLRCSWWMQQWSCLECLVGNLLLSCGFEKKRQSIFPQHLVGHGLLTVRNHDDAFRRRFEYFSRNWKLAKRTRLRTQGWFEVEQIIASPLYPNLHWEKVLLQYRTEVSADCNKWWTPNDYITRSVRVLEGDIKTCRWISRCIFDAR